jgi:hypothetical protein
MKSQSVISYDQKRPAGSPSKNVKLYTGFIDRIRGLAIPCIVSAYLSTPLAFAHLQCIRGISNTFITLKLSLSARHIEL